MIKVEREQNKCDDCQYNMKDRGDAVECTVGERVVLVGKMKECEKYKRHEATYHIEEEGQDK